MQAMLCVQILPSLYGFPCSSDICLKGIAIASPLRDVSHLCDVSIIDLLKMKRGIIPSIPSSF